MRHAESRPLILGGYFVGSLKGVIVLGLIDKVLGFVLSWRPAAPVPSNPSRILVCNSAHLGDAVLMLPALKALKDLFPSAKIDVLTGRAGLAVLEGTGLYDRCHVVDHPLLSRAKTSFWRRLRAYRRDRRTFVRSAREIGYDAAIDLYFYFPGATPLLWSAGIPVRCGFTSGGFGTLLTHPAAWSFDNRHVSQFGLQLIKILWPERTAALGRLPPCYPGHPRPSALPASPYIVIHSGAGGTWKEWPEAHWRVLADALLRERREHLVFCGAGASEGNRSRRLASLAAPDRVSLRLDQEWSEFVSLIAGAALVVCLDSVSAHLAAAFSIPTVAIYTGCNDAELWGPDNPNARVLTAPTLCAPCHRPHGCAAMACVREVRAADVLAALNDLRPMAGSETDQPAIDPVPAEYRDNIAKKSDPEGFDSHRSAPEG